MAPHQRYDPAGVDDKDTRHLKSVAHDGTLFVAGKRGADTIYDGGEPEELAERASLQAITSEDGEVAAAHEDREGNFKENCERLADSAVALGNTHDLSAPALKRGVIRFQAGDLFTAEYAAQMPQEDQHGWLPGPDRRKARGIAFDVHQDGVGSMVSQCNAHKYQYSRFGVQ